MNKFFLLILVASIFFLTLKFEEINNLIILGAFILFMKQIKLRPLAICFTLMTSSVLVGLFFLIDNQALLKYALYLLRFLALTYLIFSVLKLKLELSLALEAVFFIHAITIILCFIFPTLNDLLRPYFSYDGGSEFRISGFIQGYEFTAFLLTIYLAYDYLNLSKNVTPKFLLKLSLGLIAALLGGRYALIPVSILLIYILLDSKYFMTKISFISIGVTSFILIFEDAVQNIYQTSLMLIDLVKYGVDYDFSIYWDDGSRDQYNLSPLTLIHELTLPLYSWSNHLLPSATEILLDPGPSYMMINVGFLLTLLLYIFFFRLIRNVFGVSLPLIVIALFMVIDIKYRTLYALMPTLWILLNHVNYVNRIKRFD